MTVKTANQMSNGHIVLDNQNLLDKKNIMKKYAVPQATALPHIQ